MADDTKRTSWPVAAALATGLAIGGGGMAVVDGPSAADARAKAERQAHHQTAGREPGRGATKYNPEQFASPVDSFLVSTTNLRTDSVVSQIHLPPPADTAYLVVKGGYEQR